MRIKMNRTAEKCGTPFGTPKYVYKQFHKGEERERNNRKKM